MNRGHTRLNSALLATGLAMLSACTTPAPAPRPPVRAVLPEESGPVGPGGRPMWIASPIMHPAAAHALVAIGSGIDQRQADDAALVNLAREIAAETGYRRGDVADYRRRLRAVGEDPDVTAELLALEKVDRLVPVAGAGIADRWAEPSGTWFYAIAAVGRGRLAAAYKTEMQVNANLADRDAARAQSEPGPLRKLALARAAVVASQAVTTLAAARDRLVGDGSADEMSTALGPVQGPSVAIPDLEALIASLQNAAAVAVLDGGQDPAPTLVDTEIREALQRLRVPVVSSSSEVQLPPEARHARLLLKYAVEPAPETATDRTLANWRLTVEAYPAASNKAVEMLALDGKAGGRAYADAQNEAARDARQQLHARIDAFLDRTLIAQLAP